MKPNSASRAFTLVFVALSFLSIVALAQADGDRHCSNAAVAGKWAFTSNGSIPGIGPAAAVATLTADASGNISGSQTRSLNGDVADETFTGTETVNSDCTADAEVQVFEDGVLVRTTTLHLVYDDNARAARGIFTSLVLPDGTAIPTIITLEARRLFPRD
jgi:hypothetical protein